MGRRLRLVANNDMLCDGGFPCKEGSMPLYSYRCTRCNSEFELLVRSSDAPTCPECGSQALERQVSHIAPDGHTKARIQAGRAQAAKEGHFSHYSGAEKAKIKKSL